MDYPKNVKDILLVANEELNSFELTKREIYLRQASNKMYLLMQSAVSWKYKTPINSYVDFKYEFLRQSSRTFRDERSKKRFLGQLNYLHNYFYAGTSEKYDENDVVDTYKDIRTQIMKYMNE